MRRLLLVIALLLIAAAAGFFWYTWPLPELTVTTWPGEYGRAQHLALMEPYGLYHRVNVRIAEYEGGLDDLKHAVFSHDFNGDVIDFELPSAIEACRRGLLEKIDAGSLPPGDNGAPAAKDFVKGAVGDCWVASAVYSQAILFDKDKFAGHAPATLKDFFDTANFPGRRALRPSAKLNLEMALLADDVAPEDIYKTLESDAGVTRALNKLATLGPGLVWWHSGDEPARLLQSRQAALSTVAWSGDVAWARLTQGEVIWDHQLYELDAFGVPKGDPKKNRAMDFIAYATGTAPLARMAEWVALGPARRSAWERVGHNPDLKIAMRDYLPTTHFETAFAVDDGWWRIHGPALEARFQAWMLAQH